MNKLSFGFTGESSSIQKFSIKLGQWWYIFFATASSAVISISASFAGAYDLPENLFKEAGIKEVFIFIISNPWIWIVFGALGIIYGGKGTYIDQKNLNSINEKLKLENHLVGNLKEKINSISEDSEALQNELGKLQVKLVTTWLKGSARQLNLSTNCRTTIYYYINQHFYLLARYSQNPKYSEVHRQKFSKNDGVISKAWEHKVCIDIENIPCYQDSPEDYVQYLSDNYGYAKEKIEELTMKSCQFIAFSIIEADRHIGVIVFESDKLDIFKKQKVNQIKKYCTDYQGYMVDFINGGIKYDKTVKVASIVEHNVEQEFLSNIGAEL